MRTSIYAIPAAPTPCRKPGHCVYRDENEICDEPRINKGNSDAACHGMSNKDLLELLTPTQHKGAAG